MRKSKGLTICKCGLPYGLKQCGVVAVCPQRSQRIEGRLSLVQQQRVLFLSWMPYSAVAGSPYSQASLAAPREHARPQPNRTTGYREGFGTQLFKIVSAHLRFYQSIC